MNVGWFKNIKFTGPLALAMGSLPFSIGVCNFAIALFGIAWMVEGHWKEKWESVLKNYMVALFLLFFLLHLFGIIYSEDKHAAWFTLEKKISLLVLPLLLSSIKLEKEAVKQLLHVFLIACLLATFICLWIASVKAFREAPTLNFDFYNTASFNAFNPTASSIWMYISYIELASGIRMHPAYLSLYLSFCVFLIIHFYSDSFSTSSRSKRIIILFLLFYLGIFIIFLSTRIMIFSLLIISLYGLNRFFKKGSRAISWISSITFVAFFLGIIYLNPISRFRSYQEMMTTQTYLEPGLQTQSTTIRASLWFLSIKSLPKINWLWGKGTGDVEHLISETGAQANISNILGTNDPHSQYLQTLLGLGVLGLSTLVICFAWPIWVSYQSKNFIYLGFIFLISVLCFTETAMELQKGIVFYSLFSSLILFQYSPSQVSLSSP